MKAKVSAKQNGTDYKCDQFLGMYKRTFKKVKFRKTKRNEMQITRYRVTLELKRICLGRFEQCRNAKPGQNRSFQ